jgi:CheY-like chemotaxis protein
MEPIGTVLVVDDDATTREAYAEFLRMNRFTVITAAGGDEALDIARAALPDAILMDASMPGMEGWTAIKLLKADQRTLAIPIVVLTGHTQPADYARARECGAEAFLAKPCVPDELVRRLKDMVQRRPSA